MTDKKTGAYIALLLTFLLWGSIYVASSYATAVFSPVVVACGRYLTGTAILWMMAAGKQKTKIEKTDIKYFILIAVLGYYVTSVINTIGIKLSGPAVSSVINSLMPVGISLAGAVMLKEKIDSVRMLCIALAIAGTLIVVRGGGGGIRAAGAACMVTGIVTWSIVTIFIKKMGQKYAPEIVAAYTMSMSLLIHIPIAAAEVIRSGIQWQTSAVLAILYMGIFSTGAAQYLWGKSLSVLDAGMCSVFYPLQPVFSVILGRIFLNEQLEPGFFIGAGIIAATVVVNCLYSERSARLKS